MRKEKIGKLILHRETLHILDPENLPQVAGAFATVDCTLGCPGTNNCTTKKQT